jgi:hypothetical protein
MVGLFYIYLPMSFSIPVQIEQDIICGRASYQTFQTGNGGQSVLPVSPNSYIVIFGYDFSPAGGGIRVQDVLATSQQLTPASIRFFETQQISFYTGSDFYPFIHHVNTEHAVFRDETALTTFEQYTINNTPICRQVYITSPRSVAITVGLILQTDDPLQAAIPITDTTPQQLTFGGSGQVMNIQTAYSQGGTSPTFVQPELANYAKYGLPALPANEADQSFAVPDIANGLIDPSSYITSLGIPEAFRQAACAYFLNVHYAVYNRAVPEPRG